MSRIIQAFLDLPRPQKVILIGVLLFLLLIVGSGVWGLTSHIKDRAADAREAKKEAERQVLEDERNEAIGRAQVWEAHGKKLEEQRRVDEVIIEATGKRAEQIKGVIADEEKKMAVEIGGLDTDVDSCERVRRICARLQSLGLYPKNKECRCD